MNYRKTDGQLLDEAERNVAEIGELAVIQYLRDLAHNPSDFEAAIHLCGSYRVAYGISTGVVENIRQIVINPKCDFALRVACAETLLQRVFFRPVEHYQVIREVADYIISNKAFTKQASRAEICQTWLITRTAVNNAFSDGKIVIDEALLHAILERHEFQKRGFTLKHVSWLRELILDSIDLRFTYSLSFSKTNDYYLFVEAREYHSIPGGELYFTVGDLIALLPNATGGLGCVWYGSPNDVVRLLDARVICGL